MLFDSIFLTDKPAGGTFFEAANSADLHIKADIRNFFTLRFSSRDVESVVEQSRSTAYGFVARLSFYLRILFMKIKMQLSTDVSFFEDAAYLPLVITMPVDASKYAHPGSGTFYSWRFQKGIRIDERLSKIPSLIESELQKSPDEFAKDGLRFCETVDCNFRIVARDTNRLITMNLVVARNLVALGFYPRFSQNAGNANEFMKWIRSEHFADETVGVYWEMSRLPRGEHKFHLWLSMKEEALAPEKLVSSITSYCPRPVNITLR